VFEAIVVLLLKPYVPAASIVGSLLAYRAMYYLLPLVIATSRSSSPLRCSVSAIA